MAYTLPGTIKTIFEEQTFPSGFSKREFVVTSEDSKYPQDIAFSCLKEKSSLLEPLKPGDKVTVHFDIGGREYNGRYFVNLNAWKIDTGSTSKPSGEAADFEPEDTTDYSEPDGDNIPF